jgi:hypothetical protein
MSDRIGIGELAKRLGISRQRVNDLAREGKLTREPDGRWDPDRAMDELSKTLDSRHRRRAKVQQRGVRQDSRASESEGLPLTGSAHEIFNRARAAKEVAIAKERQLDLRHRQGELLEASEVELAWTRKLTAFKERLLAIPDRLAQKLAAIAEDREIRAILDGEIRMALKALIETKADEA